MKLLEKIDNQKNKIHLFKEKIYVSAVKSFLKSVGHAVLFINHSKSIQQCLLNL
jgi:hypothetical protein